MIQDEIMNIENSTIQIQYSGISCKNILIFLTSIGELKPFDKYGCWMSLEEVARHSMVTLRQRDINALEIW